MSARRRFPVTAYDQINLTNLIDTLFFLLIIFMITAPLLEYSVDVTPPAMNADPLRPDSDSVVINVTRPNGAIVYKNKTVSEAELQTILSDIEQHNEKGLDTVIYLRGDKDIDYGTVMNVMKLIRSSRFRNINLVMQEEPKQ